MHLARLYNADYTPEVFNGLILKKEGMTLTVFHTGTIIVTGIKRLALLYPILIQLEIA
jgi:TATA-box binding protein (TBP) (component of TFIID and TFIIIB)